MSWAKFKHRAGKRAENLLYRMGGLPITLRASVGGGSDISAQIRRAYAAHYWRMRHWSDAAEILLAIVLWPFAILLGSLYLILRNGRTIERRCGRTLLQQWRDQLSLSWRHGILPPWYYIFALHDTDRAPHAATFLNRCETKRGAFQLLCEPDDRTIEFDDKCLFAQLCRDHHLPTVPVLAVAEAGLFCWHTVDRLPDVDLFVKPLDGCGGKGAERWDHHGGLYFHRGAMLTRSQLVERLIRQGRDRPLIVQRRVINHPALGPVSNGALSTIRLLTCLDQQGTPEIIGAACRMAVGDNRTVDNLHAGGIASHVDLGSGELSRATDLGLSARVGWHDVHPDTRAVITGRILPDWPAVRALALRAHAAFQPHIFVGWDIALLEEGPCLIEGNGAPDVDLMQRHASEGMMTGRFGELLAWHLHELRRRDRKQGRPATVPSSTNGTVSLSQP